MQSQVKFNRVPEKIPEKVPEKVGEAFVKVWALLQILVKLECSGEGSGESLGGFGAEPGQVQQGSGEGSGEGLGGFGAEPGQAPEKVPGCRARSGFRRRSGRLWCWAGSGSTGFWRRVREKVPGSIGAKPSQLQQGSGEDSGEGSGEGRGGLGAEPHQVQQGSGEGSGEGLRFVADPGQDQQGSGMFRRRFRRKSGRLWCRARSGSTGLEKVPEKVCEALVQSQVMFRRRFREALVQSQVRSNTVPEKVWEALVQSQVRFKRHFGLGNLLGVQVRPINDYGVTCQNAGGNVALNSSRLLPDVLCAGAA